LRDHTRWNQGGARPGSLNRSAVITLGKIRNEVGNRSGALAAARYLLEPSEGPLAYAREGEDPSAPQWGGTIWLGDGRGLRRLGLKGGTEVKLEELTAALQGRHVTSGKQVRKPGPSPAVDGLGNRLLDANGEQYTVQVVNSFDLTFSVPKSVSVLWSQADAKLRAEIEQAIVDAANTAMEHIVRTRQVISGERVGHGFVAAASLHVAARVADGDPAPAPQLHLHMGLAAVLNERGRLCTPDSGALFKDSAMREMGAFARVVLARRFEQMGIAVLARTGEGGRYFELAGVPKELCERFSGRRRDVLAWVKRMQERFGVELTKQGAAAGAKATRRDKDRVSIADTYAWWDSSAQEFEFRVGAIQARRSEYVPEYDLAAVREEVREAILERMWKEGPTVYAGALQAMALEFAGPRLSPTEAFAVLSAMQRSGDLVMLEDGLVTSGEIRQSEEYVRDVALAAATRGKPPLSREAVEGGIEAAEASLKNKLDPEQRDAVELLTSGADWTCLTGRPGTGKGPVLEAVAEAHRREGWKVIAVALDGATATRLGRQVNGEGISFRALEARLERGMAIDDRTLILIDEASKAGLREWRVVAQACAEAELRVIPVGDVKQSGAIECPGMFDYLLEAVATATLKVVRRHRDPRDRKKPHRWLARASRLDGEGTGKETGEEVEPGYYDETGKKVKPGYHDALYAGDAETAIAVLQEEGALNICDTREEAMAALVEKWHQRRQEHKLDVRDTVLVVYGTNHDVDHVNALAQRLRLDAGEIGGESIKALDRGYRLYVGDVVMLRETAFRPRGRSDGRRSPPIENGTMGTVLAVDARRELITVAFDSNGPKPREVTIDMGALRAEWERQQARKERGEDYELVPSLRLSIAGHQFPLQGGTWWYVGSLWGDGRQRLEDVISGDARAKCILDVFADRESLGWDGTDAERFRRKAQQLSQIRHKLTSLFQKRVRGVEIGKPHADFLPAPELPQAKEAARERAREPREWHDPLRHHRELLGAHRVDMIELRSEELAALVAELEEAELEAAAERAEESFERLDPPGAYESMRLLPAKQKLIAEVQNSLERAQELEAMATETRVLGGRRERRELEAAAARQWRRNAKLEQRLAKLEDRERELWRSGRHLDAWLQAEAEPLALGRAAQRELADRSELGHLVAEDAAPGRGSEAPGRQEQQREPRASDLPEPADHGFDAGG
jgi:conjugative relaxase-like TrwC/TraI family protein